MTHTPGPWKSTPSTPQDGFECYWITAIPNPNMEKEVATVAGPQNMTNEANANLIASAPDLLAFIKKPYPIEAYDKWREAGDAASAEALDMHEGERRALIAKAEGE